MTAAEIDLTTVVPAAREIVWAHPFAVAVHPDNLRDEYRGIDELAGSIAEVGVLVPLIVVPVDQVPEYDFDATDYVVIDGHRRLLAARQLSLAAVPCDVRPDLATAKATRQAMAVTAMAREDLTAREEAKAVQLLLDLGMTQKAIAGATARRPDRVKSAKAAAALTDAVSARAEEYFLDLEQMAQLAEFQDEPDDVVRELLMHANHGWSHAVEQTRQARARRLATEEVRAELAAAGVTVLSEQPESPARKLIELAPGKGRAKSITDESHRKSCEHSAVVVTEPWWGTTATVVDFCLDPAAAGHKVQPWATGSAGKKPASDMSDEERTEKSQERRDLIARSKELDAARVVRHRFIAGIRDSKDKVIASKRSAFALDQVIERPRFVRDAWSGYGSTQMSLSDTEKAVLGIESAQAFVSNRAGQDRLGTLWALVCVAYEVAFPRDAHRDSNADRTAYMRHLVDLGYTPCDAEQLVIDGGK